MSHDRLKPEDIERNKVTLTGGNLLLELETGEVFKGKIRDALNVFMASHVKTTRWGRQQRDEKETAQEQVKALQAKVDSLQARVDVLTPRKQFWDDLPVISEVSQYN